MIEQFIRYVNTKFARDKDNVRQPQVKTLFIDIQTH